MTQAKFKFTSFEEYLEGSNDPANYQEGRFEWVDGELVEVPPEAGLNRTIANRIFFLLVAAGIVPLELVHWKNYLSDRTCHTRDSNTAISQEAWRMTISTENKVWTDEEFMALSKDGHRYELVNGELRDLGNSGMEHGGIGSFLGGRVIHPDEKYVLIYHSPEPDCFLRPQDSLDGEAIVPGFSMPVAELFEEWDF